MQEQKQKVLDTFHKHFKHTGDVIVNDDLSVTVQGDVFTNYKVVFPDRHIPVKFDQVNALFVDSTNITSFKNSPRIIHGTAWFQSNPIKNWHHAPDHAGGYFGLADTQISDLTGLPEGIKLLSLNYLPHMPLLRALQVQKVEFPHVNHAAPEPVVQILNKYAGRGKAGAMQAAGELIRAGKQIQDQEGLPENPFKANARW
jgi:hypothetical protein